MKTNAASAESSDQTVEIRNTRRRNPKIGKNDESRNENRRTDGSEESTVLMKEISSYPGEAIVDVQTQKVSKGLENRNDATNTRKRFPTAELLDESVVHVRSSKRKVVEEVCVSQDKHSDQQSLKVGPFLSEDDIDSGSENDTIPLSSLLEKGGIDCIVAGSEVTAVNSRRASRRLSSHPPKFDEIEKSFLDASFDGETVALEEKTVKKDVLDIRSVDSKSRAAHEWKEATSKAKKRVSFGHRHDLPQSGPEAQSENKVAVRLSDGVFSSKCTEKDVSAICSDATQIQVNGKSYMQVGLLGKGGSSTVYRVLAPDGQLFAYKRVDIRGGDDVDSMFEGYVNEIQLLQVILTLTA